MGGEGRDEKGRRDVESLALSLAGRSTARNPKAMLAMSATTLISRMDDALPWWSSRKPGFGGGDPSDMCSADRTGALELRRHSSGGAVKPGGSSRRARRRPAPRSESAACSSSRAELGRRASGPDRQSCESGGSRRRSYGSYRRRVVRHSSQRRVDPWKATCGRLSDPTVWHPRLHPDLR